MKTFSIRLVGTDIKPVSPIHISMPGAQLGAPKGMTPAFAPTMIVFQGDAPAERLAVPASSFRGAVRRAGAQEIFTIHAEPDYDTIYFLLIGSAKGDTKHKVVNPLVQQQWRDRNPFISLFGAGNPFIAGKAQIGHIIATKDLEVPYAGRNILRGVRRDPIKDGDFPVADLTETDQQRVFLQQQIINTRAPLMKAQKAIDGLSRRGKGKNKVDQEERTRLVGDILTTLNATLGRPEGSEDYLSDEAALERAIESLNAELRGHNLSSVSIQLPLPGYQYIPQGMPMSQTIFLNGVTEIEAGLFVQTLDRFAEKPYVGGRKNHDSGVIEMKYDILVKDDAGDYRPDGTLEVTPFGGVTLRDSTILANAWDAWVSADKSKFDFRAIDLNRLPDADADAEGETEETEVA